MGFDDSIFPFKRTSTALPSGGRSNPSCSGWAQVTRHPKSSVAAQIGIIQTKDMTDDRESMRWIM